LPSLVLSAFQYQGLDPFTLIVVEVYWVEFNSLQGLFRISTTIINNNNYYLDDTDCVNVTLNIYEPSWRNNNLLYGNYSIASIYEDIWSGYSRSTTTYTNYSTNSFNATTNITICPDGSWGGGNWGGYHSLKILIKDNGDNSTETGWVSFRAVPFQVGWGSVGGGSTKITNANVVVPVTLTKYSTGANTSGNLTSIYQWRYDNTYSGRQEYVFSVGNCYSNVSGQCTVNATQNVTIYPPSGGWKVGYNYLYGTWTKEDDSSTNVEGGSGIYIEGKDPYTGSFLSSNVNGYWKYDFRNTENITIKINVTDINNAVADVSITNVYYGYSGGGCWEEWCRSYTASTWSLVEGGTDTGGDGESIIQITPPAGEWSIGYVYIKADLSGASGTSTATGGMVNVRDYTGPNVTVVSPVNNQSITNSTLSFTFTTTENAQCSVYVANYDNFYPWYCGGWNNTNASNGTAIANQTIGACNITLYGYNGTSYETTSVSEDYLYTYVNSTWSSFYGSTGLSTGGITHNYVFNVTNWTNQDYGTQIWCYDSDYNYGVGLVTFKLNRTDT